MLNRTLPYYLEDRTGVHTASDYDDIYDRLFLRVSSSQPPPQVSRTASSSSTSSVSSFSSSSSTSPLTLAITNTGRRSSTRAHLAGTAASRQPAPSILLEFGRSGALGSVVFAASGKERRLPMGAWLRKTGVFAGSLSRKFVASDGREYRWVHKGGEGHEWTLVTSASAQVSASCPTSSSPPSSSFLSSSESHAQVVVASYTPKPPSKTAYNTSGNVLMIGEAWGASIGPEILASLTVMRHIEACGL